jgi:hypothetical protein
MPDEFDFKNYKSLEEFEKSLEGTKYLHTLYLKAVNHPIRREILNIVNNVSRISKNDLYNCLIEKQLVNDESSFNYNVDYLIKAFCIKKVEDKGDLYYEITQSGKVVEYLE